MESRIDGRVCFASILTLSLIRLDLGTASWRTPTVAANDTPLLTHELRELLSKRWQSLAKSQAKTYNKKHQPQTFRERDLVMLSAKNLKMKKPNRFQNGVQGVYCLPRIAETALVLAYLLGSLWLHEPLMPKRYGILKIYKDLSRVSSAFESGHNPDADNYLQYSGIHSFDALQSRLTIDPGLLELSYRFSMYVTLFSGEPPPVVLGASTSAMSDGKVYCYIDTLQSLSDRFEKASIIHVGAGSIQAGNRLHYTVFDGKRQDENLSLGYQTRKVELIEKGLLPFAEDFTTSDLRIEAVVEESIRLAFSYRVYSMAGEITISPGSFVKQRLAKAVEFKTQGLVMIPDHGIVDEYVSVVYGEGVIPQQKSTRLTVRPHPGNTLGRCVALVTSSLPVALLCSESDLSTFTKVWALANETKSPGENLYFTLIS